VHTYLIQLSGQIDVSELAGMSPHQMSSIQPSTDATCFTIYTDQAGLLGMLRCLHNLGFSLLSITWQDDIQPKNEKGSEK
jgi:hypothetical protein